MTIVPWLVLSAFLQMGITNGGAAIYEEPKFVKKEFPPAYAIMGIKGIAGPFFLEGSMRSDMKSVSLDNWFPMQATYQIGAGLKIGPLTVGWLHTCYHPVAPYMQILGYELRPASEGATNDIYLRLEFKSR